MDDPVLNQRELNLLQGIEQDPDVNQAVLADQLGVAVGTVNWHLKRLIEKGAIKVKRASRRKLKYIITPEGIALRARLTLDFVQQSFALYRLIRSRAVEVIPGISGAGYTAVRLQVEGDMGDVVRLTCLEHGLLISDDPQMPLIHMDGMKVLVEYPGDGARA
jgi:DNA-binding MarR family transcriptional regulator